MAKSGQKRPLDEPSPDRVGETISLPQQKVISTSISTILGILNEESSSGATTDDNTYPIIIGSRAAAFWLPSFRPFQDWDIVATPGQAYDLIKDLQVYDANRLSISYIEQPLKQEVVKRRPMTSDVQEKLESMPASLKKVVGELKDALKFEIEILPTNPQDKSLLETSSSYKLFKICNAEEGYATLNFSTGGPSKGHQCIVASVEALEALKCSHIFWPAYFAKHIADLHTLRALLPNSPSSNMGIRADKNKPLTPPKRTPELEDFLQTRILEIEAFRGTSGAHINLNVSNEDFLGRDDDLFVTRHIPHDDVHDLVKYGDIPIYDQLKTDSSKAMVSKALFEKASYTLQIQCVKEEAMVISLERFLLPGLASDPSSAYKSALIRICTNLTKGWFRQFAIDNFPRLALCDRDLLSIRDTILEKHPLPPQKKTDPMDLLKKALDNHLEDLVIVQKLAPLTRSINVSEIERIINENKRRKRVANESIVEGIDVDGDEDMKGKDSDDDNGEKDEKEEDEGESEDDEDEGESEDDEDEDEDESEDYDDSDSEDEDNGPKKDFYVIDPSSNGKSPILISFFNTEKFDGEECNPYCTFWATLSIQKLNSDTDMNHLQIKLSGRIPKGLRTFHTISTYVHSYTSGGSWGGSDIWGETKVKSQPLEGGILDCLGVDGLNEDLLMKYIIALVQPRLLSNGETPFANYVNKDITNGVIPIAPKNHLWYNLWKYY